MDSAILLASLSAAALSVGRSVAIVCLGWGVCHARLNGGKTTIKDLTQIMVFVYNPCLMITNFCESLTLERMMELWLLPVFSYI